MNTSKILDIVSNGIPFRVRVITQGEKHGLNDCITHKNIDPIVEFYDHRFHHTPNGQFASSYYLSTLLEDSLNSGLCLHGGFLIGISTKKQWPK
jgi:hypothetical protein